MSDNKPPFVFLGDPNGSATELDFLVDVPTGIQTKVDLLAHYEKEGRFPVYFGGNWDALLDCLRDFSWTNRKKIIIAHNDLPLVNREGDLRIYLEILETAVNDWMESRQGPFAGTPNGMAYVEHELVVVFPSAVEGMVKKVLNVQNG